MALIGLTATAVYHGVFPAGTTLAADVARADVAQQAKEAFTSALNVTGVIAAVLFAGLALLVTAMSGIRVARAKLVDVQAETAGSST